MSADRGGSSSSTVADSIAPLLDSATVHDRSGVSSIFRAGGRTIEAARFMQRAGGSRFMREPSLLIREAATDQLEERQVDWAYSRPVVYLDILWNVAFVLVAIGVLVISQYERPIVPLRIWIVGYCFQCIIHIVCVWFEYYRRRAGSTNSASRNGVPSTLSRAEEQNERSHNHSEDSEESDDEEEQEIESRPSSFAKRLESANTTFSFIWWILGFWFIFSDLDDGFRKAPMLSWLCTVFLAFDVFFVVFCLALACVIGIAVCCCLPCIIALLYAIKEREGASDEDLKKLPKFTFRRSHSVVNMAAAGVEGEDEAEEDAGGSGSMILKDPKTGQQQTEKKLPADATVCCICLNKYKDGSELRELFCEHHFHSSCIDTWLKVKPLCPLCKRNAFSGDEMENQSQASVDLESIV